MWHCMECLLKGALLSAASAITGRQDQPAAALFDHSAANAAVALSGPEIKLRTTQKLPLFKNKSADDSVGRVHEFDCEVRRAGVGRSE